jgi:hypothetical protein
MARALDLNFYLYVAALLIVYEVTQNAQPLAVGMFTARTANLMQNIVVISPVGSTHSSSLIP